MSKATLTQVAVQAGVSKTTASLVLSGKADRVNISQTTRQRVIEAAKEINYQPAKFNPGRINGQSGIIGLIATEFTTASNACWLQHLILAAEEKGYVIIPQSAKPQTLEKKINAIPFDAIITTENSLMTDNSPLRKQVIPIFCAGFMSEKETIRHIAPDFQKLTNELIQKLYRQNKKAIGVLCIHNTSEEQKKKANTYIDNYCERFDISPNIERLTSTELNGNEIKSACDQLIENGANGIIFETPTLAAKAMKEPSIRIKGQQGILFASYEKIEGSELLPENLLTYTTPNIEEMARLAIETLIDAID